MKPTTTPAPTTESRFLETWQAFIQAKDAVVRAGEAPLRIKVPTPESINSAELRAELDLVDEPADFYAALRERLGIGDEAIDPEQGCFYLDWDSPVGAEKLLALKGIAERCHFEFEPAPVIEGEIGGEALLLAHITSLLRAADLGLPWKVTMVTGKGKTKTPHAQIRVLSPPDRVASSVAELADLRQARTAAGLRLRETLWDNGFISHGAEADEPASFDLTTYERPSSALAPVLAGWLAGHQTYPTGMGRSVQYAFKLGAAVPLATPDMSDSPLTVVEQALMREFPGPAMEVTRSGWQLKFRFSLDYAVRVEQSLHIQNFLAECLAPYQLPVWLSGTDRLRFIARNDEKAREQAGADRLRRLVGEELTIVEGKRRFVVGTLKSVSYPKLRITLPEDFDEDDRPDLLHRLNAGELTPNLTGEREMIARLRKALDIIANPQSKLLNPQTRRVLIDAAAARGMAHPEELEPDSATRRAIAAHSFQRLNDSQARAVAAILHTPDLAMVQGPPGTGKSTAISQIIWHLVRVQPRSWLLLTSETHTAVDNALEKLENPHHNLVRPIRVGSEKSLEREGARYALPRLQAWTLGSETEPAEESAAVSADLNDNALCYWLRNISRRAQSLTQSQTQNGLVATVPTGLQAAWAAVLLTPSAPVRQLVLNAYLGHVNVVGATTGSLGDKTTYGTKTRFYQQYETLIEARKRVAEKQPLTAEARAALPAPRPEQRVPQRSAAAFPPHAYGPLSASHTADRTGFWCRR